MRKIEVYERLEVIWFSKGHWTGVWALIWCNIEGACMNHDECVYLGETLGMDGVPGADLQE